MPAEVLVASLSVATGLFARFGDGVLPALAALGLAGDVVLVLTPAGTLFCCPWVVGAVSRADGKVVLGAAVGAKDVCGVFDVNALDGYGLWYCDLDVEAVVPAVKWCSGAVVLHRDESYGADVQEFEVPGGCEA